MSNLQGETTVPEDIEESQNVDLSAMMRSMAELFGGKCKKVYEKVILKLEGGLRAMEEVALVNQPAR